MGLFTSKVLIAAIVAAVAVPTALGVVSAGRPSDDIRLTSNTTLMPPAAIAADCAGFPVAVTLGFARQYNRGRIFTLNGLPETYEAKIVKVHQAGGCLVEAIPRAPPDVARRKVVLPYAMGLRDNYDTKGEGLPVYVVAEVPAPQGSNDHVFLTLRLPEPKQVREPADPVRTT